MRKKSRSILAIVFTVCLVFALTACNGNTSTPNGKAPAGEAPATIKIGIPTPITGMIAGFGQGTPFIEQLVVDTVNADGGIYIEEYDKKIPIEIIVVDTESDPTKAGEVAEQLVTKDGVNMLLARHTPNTTVPTALVGERLGVPTVSNGCPTGPLMDAGPFKWVYHAFWDTSDAFDVFIGMWQELGYKEGTVVGFMFPNDSDGLAWAAMAKDKCEAAGYVICDPGTYPIGNTDWTPIINKYKTDGVQIIVGDDVAMDFSSFITQAAQQDLSYDLISMGRAFLFPSDANALPLELAHGLTNEVWWTPAYPFKSSLDGTTAQELADKWMEYSGDAWYATLGDKYSGMEIAVNAIKTAASLDPEKIREALAATDMETISAHIKYDPETHVGVTPITGGQWSLNDAGDKVDLHVVYSGKFAEVKPDREIFKP